MKTLSLFFFILAAIFISIGGTLDLTHKPRFAGLSKEHFWSDGLFLAIVALALAL